MAVGNISWKHTFLLVLAVKDLELSINLHGTLDLLRNEVR